jgi:hypothetical protein
MPVTVTPTETSTCLGCGEVVPADAAFCPTCGTRLIADRPMPVTVSVAEAERLEHSTHVWLVAGILAGAVLLVVAGLVVGGLVASVRGGGGADDATDAATTMDAYRPVAEGWIAKHEHVAEEAGADDANGLAAAAEDARMWIDVNREDLGILAAGAQGESAPLYAELVEIFDERAVALADIEAIASAGGGESAAADQMAQLAGLDAQADGVTCAIAEVMQAEGSEPADHITPEMQVTC